jgi:pyruvate kinase
MVSKYRPKAAIVAVTPQKKALRRMQLLWGVCPILGERWSNTDEMVNGSVSASLADGIIKTGDLVVVTAGVPLGTSGSTNMIKVHVVGNVLLRGIGIGQQAVTGKVCRDSGAVNQQFAPGDVLVAKSINEDNMPYAVKASAIIVEEGGLTSPAAIVGVSYNIPVLVGVDGATCRLEHGTIVTVDAVRGVVYQGETNAR